MNSCVIGAINWCDLSDYSLFTDYSTIFTLAEKEFREILISIQRMHS